MAKNETYFYGQGKLYLAERDSNGKPKAFRWVGDVSKLAVEFTIEALTHKESYSGDRAEVRRFAQKKEGKVTSTWHDHSPENLKLVLFGENLVIDAGSVTGEALPTGLKAGDRVTLEKQNVSDVEINGLIEGTDFKVDAQFGAIDFIREPASDLTVNYKFGESMATGFMNRDPKDLVLRYEGVNIAEERQHVVLEIYRTAFDPVKAIELITSGDDVAGLETTATILYDNSRETDPVLGNFGKLIHVGAAQ